MEQSKQDSKQVTVDTVLAIASQVINACANSPTNNRDQFCALVFKAALLAEINILNEVTLFQLLHE